MMNAITLNVQTGTRDDPLDDTKEYSCPPGTRFRTTGSPWMGDEISARSNPLWAVGTPLWTGEDERGVILTYLVEGVDFEFVA